MDLKLKGKTALITGGSEGIGKGIARTLAREGVDVAICARRKEPLEAAANEISKETGRKIVAIAADLRKDADAKNFIEQGAKDMTQIGEQWDARLTTSLLLFLMLVAYLLARRYGGPAGRKLAAALSLFAAINVPLVYKSVDIWRTVHPQTTVVPKLDPRMRPAFWSAFLLITLVWALLLTIRVRLERARAELATLRLDAEELEEVRAS